MAWLSPIMFSLILLSTVVILIVQSLRAGNKGHASNPVPIESKAVSKQDSADQVTPLRDFDFTREPPRPYRPFRSGQHVAMGMFFLAVAMGK